MSANVRDALMKADLVVPSLDAGDEAVFQRVNRPHPDITFAAMLAGLEEFCRVYRGKTWLEIFLLGGLTATDAEVAKIVKCIKNIGFTRIQLNSVARPPAEDYALPVPLAPLERYCGFFSPRAEIVAEYAPPPAIVADESSARDVLALLRRRPCSLQDVAKGLAIHPAHAAKHIETLLKKNLIQRVKTGAKDFYKAASVGE
jgi:wyosine [tRNA(Phe)-imidazoG37] synthetase (radical SAM superfamily)